MRPAESFIAQPIRDLQTMLRVIARDKGKENLLIPDGIYGASTMNAVSDFQKEHGMPPTGAADQATWEAILKEFLPARISLRPAEPLRVLLNAGAVIKNGEENPNVYIVQAMLEVFFKRYQSVESPGFSGILDDRTVSSIKSFQNLSGLDPTGKLDKTTWKNMALQYPLAVSTVRPVREK